MKCKNCGAPLSADMPNCPNCGAPNTQKGNRKPLIITLICLSAVAVAMAAAVVVFITNNKKSNPDTFDFTCAEYTDEMNRILGAETLQKDKWNVTETNAVYSGGDFEIGLDLEEKSQKIKQISVGPGDRETAVKMAAVSVMAVDPEVSQQEALTQLADLSEAKKDKIENKYSVITLNKDKKRFEIAPGTDKKKASDAVITTEPATTLPVITTEEPTTVEPTTEEPTTEEPTTEPQQNAAYSAYLQYLENNRSEFVHDQHQYFRDREENSIAFKDLNGDGVDEFVCVRYGDEQHIRINLTIFSYHAGEMITMYDEQIYTMAGAEGVYEIFVDSDSKLYSIVTHGSCNITEYDVGVTTVSETLLAEKVVKGTDGSTPPKYYIGGSSVSKSEFEDYKQEIQDKAETYLCHYYHESEGFSSSIAMSYDSACDYLRQ